MNNNRVINHDIYAEITNGLFFVDEIIFEVGTDDPEEFTFRQGGVQIIPRETTGIINQSTSQELLRFEEELNTLRERNRIENERTWADIRNMSEEELINHFDRMSQEE